MTLSINVPGSVQLAATTPLPGPTAADLRNHVRATADLRPSRAARRRAVVRMALAAAAGVAIFAGIVMAGNNARAAEPRYAQPVADANPGQRDEHISADLVFGRWIVAKADTTYAGAPGAAVEFRSDGTVRLADRQCRFAVLAGEMAAHCGGIVRTGDLHFADEQTLIWSLDGETIVLVPATH